MTILNDADAVFVGDIPAVEIYAGDLLVWPVDYTKTAYLAVWDKQAGDVNDATDALGDTPGTYTSISSLSTLPDDTWVFPTAADMGIPLTATLDTVTVKVWTDGDITLDWFYKTSANPDDRHEIQSQRFQSHLDSFATLNDRPATQLQYGMGLKIYTGQSGSKLYRAQLIVDWSY